MRWFDLDHVVIPLILLVFLIIPHVLGIQRHLTVLPLIVKLLILICFIFILLRLVIVLMLLQRTIGFEIVIKVYDLKMFFMFLLILDFLGIIILVILY
jgi:hypothetical protein